MRVLFVCFADSSHSQSWVTLFDNTELDIRVYAGPFFVGGMYPPIPWSKTTYTLSEPEVKLGTGLTISIFPKSSVVDVVSRRIIYRFSLEQRFLRRVIRKWRPEIVHALSLDPAGIFAWESLKQFSLTNRPKFVVSSWGSDILLGKDDPVRKHKLKEVLTSCDGFVADCKRDIDIALSLGLKPEAAFEGAVPVNGGLDVKSIAELHSTCGRNVILVPKAYEGVSNKTLPILEALELLGDKLQGYEVHLLMCSNEVRRYLSTLSDNLRSRTKCHSYVPNVEVVSLMDRARLMIAPSISDGTPISLLEAMAAGVLPIVSPLESIQEWIINEENGLLVNALRPDQIAEAVGRALADNEIVQRAANINLDIIKKRANRDLIRKMITEFYQRIVQE